MSDLSDNYKETLIKIDDQIVARVFIDEDVANGARQLMTNLHNLNIQTYILSGDCKSRVIKIANRLNIKKSRVFYALDPAKKLALLQRKADAAIMIGNGINDSLAMSASKLGIAVHDSSEMAKASSDIVLLDDDLSRINDSIRLSRSCRKVLTSLFFVFLLHSILSVFLWLLWVY